MGKGNISFGNFSLVLLFLILQYYTLLFYLLGWNEACMCVPFPASSF